MNVQQVTPNYNQSKISPTFQAGKIKIKNPSIFTTPELEAIARNINFKDLAKIAEEKGNDLYIKKISRNAFFNIHKEDYDLVILRFNNTSYKIRSSIFTPLDKALNNFWLAEIKIKRAAERESKAALQKEKLDKRNRRKEALKFIDDFNKQKPLDKDKKSLWQKFKEIFC